MPAPTPTASEIPHWPRTTATLNDDGSGRLTINGKTEQLAAASIDDARALVIDRVTWTAVDLGRPVRLNSTDPDGQYRV